jgi:hypothetical protein
MSLDGPSLRYARQTPLVSGSAITPPVTLPEAPTTLERARALATEIEELLVGLAPDQAGSAAYQVRLAQGLTRSLIDQLEELARGPASSRRLAR